MTDTPTGGSAFPTAQYLMRGLTIRDWFAGQALAAMLPTIKVKDWDDKDETIVTSIGELAYAIADAMLKEHEK